MKTIKVKNQSNQSLPAEIRSYSNGVMVVLIKEFETAKLLMVELRSTSGDNWASSNGEYTATISKAEFEDGGEILVRIPKK
jgi:hypothetical protein